MTTPLAKAHPFGFAVAERIKEGVSKQDVWSIFSPAGGHVPKVTSSPTCGMLLLYSCSYV